MGLLIVPRHLQERGGDQRKSAIWVPLSEIFRPSGCRTLAGPRHHIVGTLLGEQKRARCICLVVVCGRSLDSQDSKRMMAVNLTERQLFFRVLYHFINQTKKHNVRSKSLDQSILHSMYQMIKKVCNPTSLHPQNTRAENNGANQARASWSVGYYTSRVIFLL